jgi:hypothetical protein
MSAEEKRTVDLEHERRNQGAIAQVCACRGAALFSGCSLPADITTSCKFGFEKNGRNGSNVIF